MSLESKTITLVVGGALAYIFVLWGLAALVGAIQREIEGKDE